MHQGVEEYRLLKENVEKLQRRVEPEKMKLMQQGSYPGSPYQQPTRPAVGGGGLYTGIAAPVQGSPRMVQDQRARSAGPASMQALQAAPKSPMMIPQQRQVPMPPPMYRAGPLPTAPDGLGPPGAFPPPPVGPGPGLRLQTSGSFPPFGGSAGPVVQAQQAPPPLGGFSLGGPAPPDPRFGGGPLRG